MLLWLALKLPALVSSSQRKKPFTVGMRGTFKIRINTFGRLSGIPNGNCVNEMTLAECNRLAVASFGAHTGADRECQASREM